MMSKASLPVKSISLIEDLRPQFAAWLAAAADARYRVPCAGDNVLTVVFGASLKAEPEIDALLKSQAVGAAVDITCERAGSSLEFLASDADKLQALAAEICCNEEQPGVQLRDTLLLEDLSADGAAMMNRRGNAALILPGDSLLTLECEPAFLAGKLANQIEAEFSDIELISIDMRAGRVGIRASTALLSKIQNRLFDLNS